MAKAQTQTPSVGEQLRGLITASGRTAYELGAAAGVAESVVWRFLKGERDLRLETAGRLMVALGVGPLKAGRVGKRG